MSDRGRAILGRALIYLVAIPVAAFAIFPDSLTVLKLWRDGELDPDERRGESRVDAHDASGVTEAASFGPRIAESERLARILRPCTPDDPPTPPIPQAAANLLVIACSDEGAVAMGPFDRPWVYVRTISGWAHTKAMLAGGTRGFDAIELIPRDDGGEELRLSRPLASDYRLVIGKAPDAKSPRYGYVCDPDCAEDEPVAFIDLRGAIGDLPHGAGRDASK